MNLRINAYDQAPLDAVTKHCAELYTADRRWGLMTNAQMHKIELHETTSTVNCVKSGP